mmetsp:Transcript_18785/g.44609  ORF Transcript_18785/g.44609 Transcript_18785/m.44609 type:complete len:318 (-) Transcript_18785:1-954(-)
MASHGARPQHVDHGKLPLLLLRRDAGREEDRRVHRALRVHGAALHVVSELELDLPVAAEERVRVEGVAGERLLRHRRDAAVRHAAARELLVLDAHLLDLLVREGGTGELREVRADRLGGARGILLGRLVRLLHLQRVPVEGAGEVGAHALDRRLERDDLLRHIGSDDAVGVGLLDGGHQRLAVAARRPHHERQAVLRIPLGIRVDRARQREVNADGVGVVGGQPRGDLVGSVRLVHLHGHRRAAAPIVHTQLATAVRARQAERHELDAPAQAGGGDLAAHGARKAVDHHRHLRRAIGAHDHQPRAHRTPDEKHAAKA